MAIPQSAAYQGTLKRLITEADYLAEVTIADGHQPGVLDSEMFLHGSVDKWQAQINWLVRKFYQQSMQCEAVHSG